MNVDEKIIFDMYEKSQLGRSETCSLCRKENQRLSKPISIWHVGEQYKTSEYRVLFVGKAARGNIEQDAGNINGILDGTDLAKDLYYKGWPFWSYTRTIANELYGENEAWGKIAMTNMVKCNASETVDKTTKSVRLNCAQYLRKEIELLAPRNIIFYTTGYDDAIEFLFDRIENSVYQDVSCGQKIMRIWTFDGVIGDHTVRVMRTGHPERMKKEDFTGQILRFLYGKQ